MSCLQDNTVSKSVVFAAIIIIFTLIIRLVTELNSTLLSVTLVVSYDIHPGKDCVNNTTNTTGSTNNIGTLIGKAHNCWTVEPKSEALMVVIFGPWAKQKVLSHFLNMPMV